MKMLKCDFHFSYGILLWSILAWKTPYERENLFHQNGACTGQKRCLYCVYIHIYTHIYIVCFFVFVFFICNGKKIIHVCRCAFQPCAIKNPTGPAPVTGGVEERVAKAGGVRRFDRPDEEMLERRPQPETDIST